MKTIFVVLAAMLSLNATAASIPPETHTINGMSIYNENGVMWSRGEALYDADSNSLALVQYIKAPNGTWTKNVWMAPCDRKKTGLVRQTRGMWSNNARVYDMTSERTVVDDSAGVTAFKTALCPAGKMKSSTTDAAPAATGAAAATTSGGPIRLTLAARESTADASSSPVELIGKVNVERLSGSSRFFFTFITDNAVYRLPAFDDTVEAVPTLKQLIQRGKPVKLSGYTVTSNSGSKVLDWSKPMTLTSE